MLLRLFIALNFDRAVKARLYHLEELVKSQALQGNFTLPENLHLTLAFLGEVPAGRLGEVRAILKQVPFAPVKLEISGCGAFGSRGCDRSGLKEQLLWVGTPRMPRLEQVHNLLVRSFKLAQLPVDEKPFVSHITLARRCVLPADFSWQEAVKPFLPITATVDHLSLMQSERVRGRLVYREL